MFEFFEATIERVHEAYKNGSLTCEELITYYIKRIEKYDSIINSIIFLNPNAINEARDRDEKIKEGKIQGVLFGIPVMLKDNVDTFDMPTTAGSESLRGFVPTDDAFITARLKEAGAIILAKTNLHEFAVWGETISSILGQSVNPYDLSRTPGGSSGGTGAAIASNIGIVGVGTDTINSIRSPSSANSLVGIRPTIGLVSRGGIVPYSLTQDTAGPICRTVEDAVRTLDVISVYDKNDDETAWAYKQKPESYLSFLNKDGLKGKKIGVLESFFGKIPDLHDATNAVVKNAIGCLKKGGAEVVSISEVIDSGWLTKDVSVHLHDLKTHLNKYLSALPENAPVHSLEEIIESRKFHEGIKDNIIQAMQYDVGTPEYNKRKILQEEIRLMLMKIMADYDIDAMVYPHQQQLVCKIGEGQQQRNGVLCSVTGFPSIAVPAGFTNATDTAPIGVPVGMEIIGRPFSEPVLIEIAYAFEQISKLRKPPVSVPEII